MTTIFRRRALSMACDYALGYCEREQLARHPKLPNMATPMMSPTRLGGDERRAALSPDPRETGSVNLGGIVRRTPHPADPELRRFFPHGDHFRGLRVHQTRLQGSDASSDSYCFID